MNRPGAPTTYNRIIPDRGCGFILKRIADLTENANLPRGMYCKNPTKQDVYLGTPWANRPGYASILWSSLISDRLIAADDGLVEYEPYRGFHYMNGQPYKKLRANGHYEDGLGWTVRYHLTDKGRKVFMEMMERITETYMKKKLFGDLDKTIKTEVPPGPAEREFNAKQKLDAIINDLMDLRDSLS